jgi:hypothetical protein
MEYMWILFRNSVVNLHQHSTSIVWLYDQEGKWKIEPGRAAILIMEHVHLIIKFGFSRLVPEVIASFPIIKIISRGVYLN